MIKGFFNEYRFLSNFWDSPIEFYWPHSWPSNEIVDAYKQITYKAKTVEHAYQAYKAVTQTVFFGVLSIDKPGEAKRYARKIQVRKDWDQIKFDVMSYLVWLKFRDNIELRNLLLGTGEQQLEETNTWGDTYWGVCNGYGQNNLGKILMNVREIVK